MGRSVPPVGGRAKGRDWEGCRLAEAGRFLFTSGDVKDTTEGEMNGVAFQYTSLGVSGYRDVIERAGMSLEASYHDEWDNYVYIAEKAASDDKKHGSK